LNLPVSRPRAQLSEHPRVAQVHLHSCEKPNGCVAGQLVQAGKTDRRSNEPIRNRGRIRIVSQKGLRACRLPSLLKTLPAEYGPSLCRLERDRSLLSALRTHGPRLHLTESLPGCRPQDRDPLGLTRLAAFRFVSELLIVKEKLLPCREDEISTAVNTFQQLVLEFHRETPPSNAPPRTHTQANPTWRVEVPLVNL
jgi:hypothetical protein